MAAATRARDGVELVGALAGQLAPRFEAAAVAVWLLDADGALELLGPGRPRRHRLEPLAAAAAAVRLPGAAGGRRRRGPVVGGRAAAVRPGGGRGALGTARGPRGARAAGPGGHPARRGRGLVAGAAAGVRRRHPGPAGRDGGRIRRRARRAPRLRAHRGGDAVPGRLRGAGPDRGLGAAGPAAARRRRRDHRLRHHVPEPRLRRPARPPGRRARRADPARGLPGLGVGRRPLRAGRAGARQRARRARARHRSAPRWPATRTRPGTAAISGTR